MEAIKSVLDCGRVIMDSLSIGDRRDSQNSVFRQNVILMKHREIALIRYQPQRQDFFDNRE